MSSVHPFPGRAPAGLLPARETALPSACPAHGPSAPCPMALLPAGAALLPQFPHQQSIGLSDPVGSITSAPRLGAALHTWMVKAALPGHNSLSPCHPRRAPWVPLLVLSPHRDLTLTLWVRPLCCCQGTHGGTRSGTTPRWLSQLVTVRGRGDDIPAPAKTNTAPSKRAGLGKPTPRPSITEPAVLQPTTAHPRSRAGEKQQGVWGGLSKPPAPLPAPPAEGWSIHIRTLPGAGGSPWAPRAHRVLGNVRGSVPTPWHAESARGRDSSSLGWLCRRVPCGCWLSPRQKVGQSQLQALTIINHAQASICHWAGAGKDQISQTSGGGSVGGRGQSGRSWRGRRGSVLSTVS